MRTRILFVTFLFVSLSLVSKFRAQVPTPLTLVAYGDTRFTSPGNVTAADPQARRALIAKIAEERPAAIIVSGDLPWHGVVDDYAQYRTETQAWRAQGIRVIPAIGNHEFSQCAPDVCLENWWAAFPELRGKRWHASDIGQTRVLALDSMSPLTAGSPQREWLEHEIDSLPRAIDFVIVSLHHPPVADVHTRLRVDHNPRPNEIALAAYLDDLAPRLRAKLLVIAGHIHNYERFAASGVTYLVSGGGGAVPYEVDRTQPDLYHGIDFPNFHYVRLTVTSGTLKGQMFRLDEPAAPTPHFTLKDTFELSVGPPRSE
jgi:hypothetical protein